MDGVRYVTYGSEEKAIIRQGIDAIREVLLGQDNDRKLSLLLALDWFMDPYFKHGSSIRSDLKELLQIVVVESGSSDVSEDALNLLTSYEWPPFPILEQNLDRIPDSLKPEVRYAIHMDQENL